MSFRAALRGAALLAFLSGLALGQGTSDSFEREARSAFKAGRFREAAIKFQDAAEASGDLTRRAKMELQSAYAHSNDKNPKAAREALRRTFTANPEIEIVPEFFSPDFLKLVEDVKQGARPVRPTSPADLGELKRMSAEKLRDGHADEVVYDLTNVPPDRLDPEAWSLLAAAYDRLGRPDAANSARRAAAGDRSAAPPPAPPPAPTGPTVSPAPAPRPNDPANLLAGGREALVKGDVMTAQAAANRALEVAPASSEAYRLLADSLVARGERPLAEANWKQSLKYDEKNEASLLALADLYVADKSWDAAVDFLRKATAVNPANGARLLTLGRRLRTEGDLPHARQVYAAAADASKGDVPVLTEYGALLLAIGDTKAALEPLMQATVAEPKRSIVHANLAAALRRAGQPKEAEREYRESLRTEPDYLPALTGLGALLLATDRPKEAVDSFRRAAAKDTKNVDALVGLARAQRTSGDISGAAARLAFVERTVAQAREIDEPELWNEAGAVAYEQGRFGEAAELFDRALAKDPTFAPALGNREKARSAAAFLKAAGAEAAAAP